MCEKQSLPFSQVSLWADCSEAQMVLLVNNCARVGAAGWYRTSLGKAARSDRQVQKAVAAASHKVPRPVRCCSFLGNACRPSNPHVRGSVVSSFCTLALTLAQSDPFKNLVCSLTLLLLPLSPKHADKNHRQSALLLLKDDKRFPKDKPSKPLCNRVFPFAPLSSN